MISLFQNPLNATRVQVLPRDLQPRGTQHNSPGNEESFQVRPSELSNNHKRVDEHLAKCRCRYLWI